MGVVLNPLDVLEFLVENGGRTTNNEIVHHFSSAFRCPINGANNKIVLKKLLHHTATLRRQGSNLGSVRRTSQQEGKLIVLRKRYKGKSSLDIWCSLILSLSREEINILQPDISFPPQEASVETNELRHHENIIEEDSPTNTVTSEVLSVDEAIKDNTDSANKDQLDCNKDDNAFKESENQDDTEKDKRPRLEVEVIDYEEETYNEASNENNPKIVSFHEDPADDNETEIPIEDDTEPVSATEMEDDVFENDDSEENLPRLNMSVRDLRVNFDKYASNSDLTLADHIKSSKSLLHLPPTGTTSRPRRNLTNVSASKTQGPLTPEGRAWLHAALRQEYSVMAKMAAKNPSLVKIREPANGYTALHLAARWGRGEIVKLLAGTYRMNPNIRTWGGYTPLMIAGIWKKHEIYRILVEVYGADEGLRDYGGFTSQYYLENRLQVPGFPDTRDMSHNAMDTSDNSNPTPQANTTTATGQNNFMREIKDSIRDSFRSGIFLK